jgi:hypothetical protein
LERVTTRRRLLMQLVEARDMLGYVAGYRQEARNALLAANRWLRNNPEDWPIREARDRLREALLPAILQPQWTPAGRAGAGIIIACLKTLHPPNDLFPRFFAGLRPPGCSARVSRRPRITCRS